MTENERVTTKSGGGWPYAVCAMALVAGGLMPVFSVTAEGGYHFALPVAGVFDGGQAMLTRIAVAAPIAAWLVLSVTLMFAKGVTRGLLMQTYAVVVWVVLFSLPDTQWSLVAGLQTATKGINGLWPIAGAMGLVAVTLTYAGNRARVLAPDNRIAAIVGALAPLYLVLALLYPFNWPEIGFMGPIHLIEQEDGVWSHQMMGFFRIFATLVLGASALIAAGNTSDTPAAVAKAKLALRVWWLHLILIVLGVALIPAFLHYDDGLPWPEVIAAGLNLLRSALLTLGWLFLLLCSSTELLAAGATETRSN